MKTSFLSAIVIAIVSLVISAAAEASVAMARQQVTTALSEGRLDDAAKLAAIVRDLELADLARTQADAAKTANKVLTLADPFVERAPVLVAAFTKMAANQLSADINETAKEIAVEFSATRLDGWNMGSALNTFLTGQPWPAETKPVGDSAKERPKSDWALQMEADAAERAKRLEDAKSELNDAASDLRQSIDYSIDYTTEQRGSLQVVSAGEVMCETPMVVEERPADPDTQGQPLEVTMIKLEPEGDDWMTGVLAGFTVIILAVVAIMAWRRVSSPFPTKE